MKIAYFDCFAGAGGDMIVAAMLDAGLDAEYLKSQLATLELKDFEIEISETKRAGLRAISFTPVISEQKQHRNLNQITEIINKSKITDKAKKTAITIFTKLAGAEAAVHNKEIQEIHFHEVGAIDSIIDIISVSIGIEALKIKKVYCSTISVGGGTVKCAHGLLPVPAPATAKLLEGIPIVAGPAQVELLTPTAAAILTTIVDRFGFLPPIKIEATGYGAGTLQSEEFPNVLRLLVGQSVIENDSNADSVCLLETNIDDSSGEVIGFVTEKLFEAGTLDVFTAPVYMKHNRPAVKLSVLCDIDKVQQVERIIFEQGLTFGIRKQILQRSKLTREFVTVQTEFGEVKIKIGYLDGKVVTAKPEYSDCVSAAQKYSVPVKTVLNAAVAVYEKKN